MENKDPKSMTDEELDVIINPSEEPEEIEETPAVEPKGKKLPDEPKKEEAEELTAEEEPEAAPKEEEKPSRRKELRIDTLLAKLKEKETRPTPTAVPDSIDYSKDLDTEPEIAQRLEEDRRKSNQAFFNQGLEQSKSLQFQTRLEIDAPRVEAKYPQLDKDSAEFHPGLAAAVNNMFLTTVGYDQETGRVANPNLRYSVYVESIFELASEIAGEQNVETTKTIKRQAAQTGLRPDGSGSKKLNLNKPPAMMTDEELDAAIKLGIPN